MNAAETIAAAIEKLEHDRDDSTPGPWRLDDDGAVWTEGETVLGGTIATWDQLDGYPRGDYRPTGDMALIVTLHRTIDAQLKALEAAAWLLGQKSSPNNYTHAATAAIVGLAESILGVSS